MSTQSTPISVPYSGEFVQGFKREAKHVHVVDGGHSECFGDGKQVLRVVHRSRRNQHPRAYLYTPGCTNDFGGEFTYADYFLPEDMHS